ncbi:MAG: pyridoxamine 5'-phosphate oxidase family protein, partial [Kiloniellales bacterium]
TARLVEGTAEKLAALEAFSERMTPGRWAELRPPTGQEIKATTVLSLELDEVAAKVRDGPPSDEKEDYGLDIWAGVVPTSVAVGAPEPDPRLKPGIGAPPYLAGIRLD